MKNKQKILQKGKIIFIVCLLLLLCGLLLLQTRHQTKPHQNIQSLSKTSCPNFTVLTPKPRAKITSPLMISAVVDNTKSTSCHWTVFEAQAGTMTLTDTTGKIIGNGTLNTTDEWMTEKAVTYNGTITLNQKPASSDLILTISEEKPSGEDGQKIIIPLTY